MKKFLLITGFLVGAVVLLTSCNDDDVDPIVPDAGTISGGPFTFVVDGMADMVSGITLDGSQVGTNSSWVITDDQNNILGLPPTMADLEMVDFDGAGVGVCFIWYLRYEDIMGLEAGMNTDNLTGTFDLSNSITVNRDAVMGASIEGGPFTFVVDGVPDMVSGITLDDSGVSADANTTWVITDGELNILGLPPTLMDVEGVDFDGAGTGVCLIWHLTYADGIMGLEMGANAGDLEGSFSLSNSITVNRAGAGTLTGGPFTFIVDGTADNVSGIGVMDNQDLANVNWIVTDDANNILGLPPTIPDVEGVDFDGAGAGICLIWRITFEDGLTGLETGQNVSGVMGTFSLSDSIVVVRASAGTISGGPFTFTVDGTADNVSGISVADNQDLANTGWIVTDDANEILGLPPTMTDLEGVDFDGAGTGVCFIWRITYEDGITGLSTGENVSGLDGTFHISNSIQVTRN